MNEADSGLPVAEAARLLQTTPLNVLMHIKRGLLKGSERDGAWLVERASLEALLASNDGDKTASLCARQCAKKTSCAGGCT